VFYFATVFNSDVSKWNTGTVKYMISSKCTLSPSLWPRHLLLWYFLIQQLEFHLITILARSFDLALFVERYVAVVCDCGLVFLSLLHLLLQCFITHVRLIQTCQNGIRVRWQIWRRVSVISPPLSVAKPSVFRFVVLFNIRQFEFHLITILTRSIILFVFGW